MTGNTKDNNTISDLTNLSKPELIQLILKLTASPIIQTTTKRPIPTPRKGVKQLVEDYENNIIQPPPQFRDGYMPRKPILLPRTVKPVEKPIPAPRTRKTMIRPVPAPRTIIEQTAHALKDFTVSYQINIKNNTDPLVQLKATRKGIEHHLKNRLISMKGLKFVETLNVIFNKLTDSEMIQKKAYFNSAAQTIINPTEISEATESSKQQILNKVSQWVSEGSGWVIQSLDAHYLNIVHYKPMRGSSYIKLPLELRNASKGLINLKNTDAECFRWCHMILLTIMSVKKIELFDELFEIRDEGLDGFVIECENVDYYNDFTGYPFVRFRCFDDYSKFFDIDCWLHFFIF